MPSKSIKLISFYFYTWCIYQSYFFIVTPIYMYQKRDYFSSHLVIEILLFFIFILPLIIMVIQNLNFYMHNFVEILPQLILSFLILIIYAYIFVAWWKKQTLLMAWIMALMGMCVGPGLAFCISGFGNGGDIKGLAAIIGINLFYFLLFIGNIIQRKYWPDNKLCNKIRFILTWPCLRT